MKNNQSHLGIIRTSNLCTEIVQYASTTETAVCTLASIAVARFVRPDRTYDFDSLESTVRIAVMCLDQLVDGNTYPTDCSRRSALRTRSLGIGVQGLADTFMASRTVVTVPGLQPSHLLDGGGCNPRALPLADAYG